MTVLGLKKASKFDLFQKFVKQNSIGTSAIKSWEKSRIFRYGLPKDFFSKWQKTQGGLEGKIGGGELSHASVLTYLLAKKFF